MKKSLFILLILLFTISAAAEGAASVPLTKRICAGSSACAVLLDDGTVSCSLDRSGDQYISVNDEWKAWTDVIDIDMTEEILVAAQADGSVVWCGGRTKEYDWLTDPEYMAVTGTWTDAVQVAASCYDIACLRRDGTVEITGLTWTEDLAENGGFVQISVYDAILCLRADGTVYCYAPYTYDGQDWSYDTRDWSSLIQVSAGFDHAAGLRADGTVVATGCNEYGQCDTGSWTDITQVCAGRFHTVGLKSDGSLMWCGTFFGGEADMGFWTDVIQISCFFDQVMGLKNDGTVLYSGGANRAAGSLRP